MHKIFAITTRGLETVSAEEIGAVSGLAVVQVGYRRVGATCVGPLAALLELRTVDDVFLDVAVWYGVGRPRSTLEALSELSAQLNLYRAVAACAQVRDIPNSPSFSVTVNFVGKRNYSTHEVKQVCAESIQTGHGWSYTDDDAEADLNVRMFIEHETAYVGLRLGSRSLHRRLYKRFHAPGSLKPSVAAALLHIVGVQPGARLIDPCCGAGTIVIEAAFLGMVAWGGDNDPAALAATRANSDAASKSFATILWDAQQLPLATGSTDRIVSNLPWGRQADVEPALSRFYGSVCSEMYRVLAPGGRIALLTDAPHLVDLPGLECDRQIEISLFGQTPTISVFRKA